MKRLWTKGRKSRVALLGAVSILCVPLYTSWRDGELWDAIQDGNPSRVTALLRQGADPNAEVCTRYISPYWPEWVPSFLQWGTLPKRCNAASPLLSWAARSNTPHTASVVEALLHAGAKVDASNTYNNTALGFAVVADDEATTKILLAHGANPNKLGFSGSVPLFTALRHKNTVLLRLLIAHGARITPNQYGATLLQEAARVDNVAAMEFLLNQGININERNTLFGDGKTALIVAAELGQSKATAFLLEHGAKPNAQDDTGSTALHYALGSFSSSKTGQISRLLIQKGAFLFIKNNQGNTPFEELPLVCAFRWSNQTANGPQAPPILGAPPLPDDEDEPEPENP